MPADRLIRRYEIAYAILPRLFPCPFRDRFGEEMRQTFHDVCREHARAGPGLRLVVLRSFADTMIQISKQHLLRVRPMRKGIVAVFAVTGLILMIPAVAMRYSDEVNWTAFDFLVAGMLLMGSGLTAEYLWRGTPNVKYRAASLLAVFTGLFVIWANLAVGIIGNENHPANWFYLIVLSACAIGAFWARLRPAGMAIVMNATAVAIAAVPFVAYVIWRMPLDMDLLRSVLFNSFIAVSFAGSGWLYRQSALQAELSVPISR